MPRPPKITVPERLEDLVILVLEISDKLEKTKDSKVELRELRRLRDTLIAAQLDSTDPTR